MSSVVMLEAVWRMAVPSDDEAIVRMCLALYTEDPGPEPVPAENVRQTLHAFRETPRRGRAVVLEIDRRARGYALLVPYWSNELGGEIDVIDELYVDPEHRGRRHATILIEALAARTGPLASNIGALILEITPDNHRARRLYERLGFKPSNLTMRRPLPR
jgi:GNAT superfamily N-acetyltransferase